MTMAKRPNDGDRRVDLFVGTVNASRREPLDRDEVPPACLLNEAELRGFFHWRIVHSPDANWLPEIEANLPFRLPLTFRSLLARYLFPSFSVGPLTLYSVGVNDPHTAIEFRRAIFADRHLSPFLLGHGFIPFARPADWNYDPICFDYRAKVRKSEPPVVRIDHEEILCQRPGTSAEGREGDSVRAVRYKVSSRGAACVQPSKCLE